MSDYTTQATKAAATYLDSIAKAQDEAIKTVTAFVAQLPKSTAVDDDPGAGLPTSSEISEVAFDFAEKMLAQNRSYTAQLIAVLEPAKV